MFKCENCAAQISAKIPSQLIAIIIRKKHYKPIRTKIENRSGRLSARQSRAGRKADLGGYWTQKGGTGYETVREIRVCPDCADILALQKPLMIAEQ